MRFETRLRRLEIGLERPTLIYRVVWDVDDDPEAAPGPRIRLRWGDDREVVGDVPETP
jgi:hypothetical protein